jgi:H+/gluconate symporter-like permease
MRDIKQKAIHEGQEFAGISLYLAFFFCAVVAYSSVLLGKFHVSFFSYGSALINALVIAKVILIGEYAHLGKKQEARPLVFSALNKAFLFTLLVFAFHLLEEVIKQLVHGDTIASAFHQIRIDILICRSLVVFCTFIPLFAFRDLQRVLGEDNFRSLFFRSGTMSKSNAD